MFELIIILSRFMFLFLISFFLYHGIIYALAESGIIHEDLKDLSYKKQQYAIFALHICTFAILVFGGASNVVFKLNIFILALGSLVFFAVFSYSTRKIYHNSCPIIFNTVFFLMDIGLIMLTRINYNYAERQFIWFFVGAILLLMALFLLRFIKRFEKLKYLYLLGSALLLSSTLIWGSEKGGATNWIIINEQSFQPSELAKFLFVFYLASALYKIKEMKQLIETAIASGLFIVLLVVQKDLGTALIFFMTYMVMLYISSGNILLFMGGLLSASLASVMAYKLFYHVRVRVMAWQNPWQDPSNKGYQIIQSLFAIGTWGVFGSGLTRGEPYLVPVVASDFIFAAICEEFGGIFGILLIGVFVLLFFRGTITALKSKRKQNALLAAGMTCLLAFQTFLIIGGNIKLIPLTGVTLPFISQGGSSIIVCLLIIGIIQWLYMQTMAFKSEPQEDKNE